MSSKLLGLHSGGGETEQDFELNLASIIDCFTVLITYLLISASFLTIGMFDVNVPSVGPASNSTAPTPKITLSVKLKQNGQLTINVSGAAKQSLSLSSKDKNWDFDQLAAQVEEMKKKWPAMDTAMISADGLVEYAPLVKAIDQLRKHLPFVFIGER